MFLNKTIIVTGGCGFIGSALIRYLIQHTDYFIINIDKLTYAGNLKSLSSISQSERYCFVHADINDCTKMTEVFTQFRPVLVMNLAAESHVDRSIKDSNPFINSNILGTHTLLEVAHHYWDTLDSQNKANFKFHQISTDEVYGALQDDSVPFTEKTPFNPSSPYSASKASADHLVKAWHRTYDLPVVITHCSNNYGPFHLPEKLIPLIIMNALHGKPLPIYGHGNQIRDWLYVEDHVRALYCVATTGKIGESYNIGGNNERKNIEVVTAVCQLLEKMTEPKNWKYEDLITFVKDRPGHDYRYAIDSTKIQQTLGWSPAETFDTGLEKTVRWYLENLDWSSSFSTESVAEFV